MYRDRITKNTALLIAVIFILQSCALFGIKSELDLGTVTSLHIAVGNKLLNTNKNIENQCQLGVLLDEEGCKEAKAYYNVVADIYDISTQVLNAELDKENADKYITLAIEKIAGMSGKGDYAPIINSTLDEVRFILTQESLDNINKTERVLSLVEDQALNIAILILKEKEAK